MILKKAITENAYNDLIEKKGIVYASYIYENIILNMYESCKQKILTLEKNNMEKILNYFILTDLHKLS